MMHEPLFPSGEYTGRSGRRLPHKIECDPIDEESIGTIARSFANHFRFREVYGVPRGGQRIADALSRYRHAQGPILVVDDVYTTGGSMRRFIDETVRPLHPGDDIKGFVLFAWRQPPEWIEYYFLVSPWASKTPRYQDVT